MGKKSKWPGIVLFCSVVGPVQVVSLGQGIGEPSRGRLPGEEKKGGGDRISQIFVLLLLRTPEWMGGTDAP